MEIGAPAATARAGCGQLAVEEGAQVWGVRNGEEAEEVPVSLFTVVGDEVLQHDAMDALGREREGAPVGIEHAPLPDRERGAEVVGRPGDALERAGDVPAV